MHVLLTKGTFVAVKATTPPKRYSDFLNKRSLELVTGGERIIEPGKERGVSPVALIEQGSDASESAVLDRVP